AIPDFCLPRSGAGCTEKTDSVRQGSPLQKPGHPRCEQERWKGRRNISECERRGTDSQRVLRHQRGSTNPERTKPLKEMEYCEIFKNIGSEIPDLLTHRNGFATGAEQFKSCHG